MSKPTKTQRFFSLVLVLCFFLSPFTSHAGKVEESEEDADNTPIYLYQIDDVSVLGIAQISGDLLLGCIGSIATSTEVEEVTDDSFMASCALAVLDGTSTASFVNDEAGVLHAFLKARYLDSKRGQFLSQDPVFWEIAQSPDGIAVLRNPQAQNSYSYGQNNPIVNKDPDGRIAILAPILIGGGVGMLGGIGGQLISDYNSGEWSDLSTYGTAAVSGATVGVGVTIAGMTGGVLLVAGTAGGLTAGMQMASDAYLGKQTDYRDVITNSILSAGTAGVLKGVPAMKGRWPGLSSSALVVGRHTQRQAAEEAFSSGLQAVRQSVGTFISSSQSSSRSSGSSNNSSYVKQLKSIVTQLQSIVSKLKSLKK